MGLYIFLAILGIGGVGLFSALNANRAELNQPATSFVAPDPGSRISSPPPLAVPQAFGERRLLPPSTQQPEPLTLQPAVQLNPPPAQARIVAPAPAASLPPVPPPAYTPPREPIVAYRAPVGTAPAAQRSADGKGADRVQAERFVNPSLTIPKGTVIPAVLETALDSTRPGGVRALVQRNIYSFDGTRVLIQRGSRLIGEYDADLQPGQKRALIQWTRLVRPDGVIIALDSPASDPLGRAGVKGKVDSKFLQRFGGAVLQSVLDIGVNVASRKVTDGVIVALPGSTQNVTATQPQQVQPTLSVRHGTSVSVFVARDLDFSSVES
ncbi:MAG: TrbI/VirB10 family protein [Sphingomonadaceae bacterium]|nr:TrbI/VirB10 family protein [Sphingomonadaceae bacterium]